MCFRSSLNACRSSSLAKYLFVRAHSVIVSTTRPMSCLTLRSRSGVPICPRKYFETTMLVACCDQNFGISTSRCSKTTSPRSLPMTAARSSHSTSSNGSTPASVKKRGNVRPGAASGLRLRARLVGVDKRVSAARPDSTALDRSAGRHLRPGRQRLLSCLPLRFAPELLPEIEIAFRAPASAPRRYWWSWIRVTRLVLEMHDCVGPLEMRAHIARSWEDSRVARLFALTARPI